MSVGDTQTVDFERIDDATGGDQEFLKELVEIFLDDASARIDELKDAVASGDADSVGRTAHKLKGSSANMGAVRVYDLATKLEALCHSHTLGGAAPVVDNLEVEFVRVRNRLQLIVAG